ncbi:uncharacterized protein LOC135309373 [Passer domesticus]|uniref:uncharacterized protein LOC135309373 n=1 Tax=Passer domesticus TaxID=48849 RepID=UPI0030FE7667
MWKILQVPCVPCVVTAYFPRLFVHLLFQVFFSTEEMPEEVDTFWKECQEEHGLATSPNRFAVQTLKSLLCLLQCEDVVVAMECRCGWDTLLCVDTCHYAVGLLAREISSVSIPSCSRILRYLLWLLSTQEPHWDLPALAFFVEVLECLDLSEHDAERVLQIFSRYLQNECKERRRLVLKALLKLTDDPLMTKKMWSLTESLVELLQDADGETVKITVMVLSFIVMDKDTPIPSLISLQLAEALVLLFDHDNWQVQLLSIWLFRTLMTLPLEKKRKALKTPVCHSLLALFFHCRDGNRRVAEASQETLLCAIKFLKKRDLEKLVKKEKLWIFANCLLKKDKSRVAKHLRWALRYLESPQESLREAAIRFMGIAGKHLKGQQQELQLICRALKEMAYDMSLSVSCLASQTLHVLSGGDRARHSTLENLQDRLHRVWKRWPRLSGLGWLLCWSSAKS